MIAMRVRGIRTGIRRRGNLTKKEDKVVYEAQRDGEGGSRLPSVLDGALGAPRNKQAFGNARGRSFRTIATKQNWSRLKTFSTAAGDLLQLVHLPMLDYGSSQCPYAA